MPYYLGNIIQDFKKKKLRLENRAHQILDISSKIDYWKYRYLSESLIQETWQDWVTFCRTIVLKSCQGCKCIDGKVISPRLGNNTWQSIGFIFKFHKPGLLNNSFIEPTWGDIDKLLRAITTLKMGNENALISSFGLTNLNESAKHLQTVRNSIAHKNAANINQFQNLQIYYSIQNLSAPHDLIWQDHNNGGIAFFKWLNDLIAMAELSGKSSP